MKEYLLIALLFFPLTVWAAPFGGEPVHEQQSLNPLQQSVCKINAVQYDIKQCMSGYVREYKQGGHPLALVVILVLSFLYGVIHAAGPGHGKSIVLAYLLTRNDRYLSGIVIGALAAFMHGVTAIVTVLIIYFLALGRMSTTFASISDGLMLVSYSLIVVIGLWLLVSRLRNCRANTEPDRKNGIALIASIGLVPCPGVMIILLFFMAMQMLPLGIVMGLIMSLGMALTVALIAVLGVGGKHLVEARPVLKVGVEISGALLVVLMGSVLLAAKLM